MKDWIDNTPECMKPRFAFAELVHIVALCEQAGIRGGDPLTVQVLQRAELLLNQHVLPMTSFADMAKIAESTEGP